MPEGVGGSSQQALKEAESARQAAEAERRQAIEERINIEAGQISDEQLVRYSQDILSVAENDVDLDIYNKYRSQTEPEKKAEDRRSLRMKLATGLLFGGVSALTGVGAVALLPSMAGAVGSWLGERAMHRRRKLGQEAAENTPERRLYEANKSEIQKLKKLVSEVLKRQSEHGATAEERGLHDLKVAILHQEARLNNQEWREENEELQQAYTAWRGSERSQKYKEFAAAVIAGGVVGAGTVALARQVLIHTGVNVAAGGLATDRVTEALVEHGKTASDIANFTGHRVIERGGQHYFQHTAQSLLDLKEIGISTATQSFKWLGQNWHIAGDLTKQFYAEVGRRVVNMAVSTAATVAVGSFGKFIDLEGKVGAKLDNGEPNNLRSLSNYSDNIGNARDNVPESSYGSGERSVGSDEYSAAIEAAKQLLEANPTAARVEIHFGKHKGKKGNEIYQFSRTIVVTNEDGTTFTIDPEYYELVLDGEIEEDQKKKKVFRVIYKDGATAKYPTEAGKDDQIELVLDEEEINNFEIRKKSKKKDKVEAEEAESVEEVEDDETDPAEKAAIAWANDPSVGVQYRGKVRETIDDFRSALASMISRTSLFHREASGVVVSIDGANYQIRYRRPKKQFVLMAVGDEKNQITKTVNSISEIERLGPKFWYTENRHTPENYYDKKLSEKGYQSQDLIYNSRLAFRDALLKVGDNINNDMTIVIWDGTSNNPPVAVTSGYGSSERQARFHRLAQNMDIFTCETSSGVRTPVGDFLDLDALSRKGSSWVWYVRRKSEVESPTPAVTRTEPADPRTVSTRVDADELKDSGVDDIAPIKEGIASEVTVLNDGASEEFTPADRAESIALEPQTVELLSHLKENWRIVMKYFQEIADTNEGRAEYLANMLSSCHIKEDEMRAILSGRTELISEIFNDEGIDFIRRTAKNPEETRPEHFTSQDPPYPLEVAIAIAYLNTIIARMGRNLTDTEITPAIETRPEPSAEAPVRPDPEPEPPELAQSTEANPLKPEVEIPRSGWRLLQDSKGRPYPFSTGIYWDESSRTLELRDKGHVVESIPPLEANPMREVDIQAGGRRYRLAISGVQSHYNVTIHDESGAQVWGTTFSGPEQTAAAPIETMAPSRIEPEEAAPEAAPLRPGMGTIWERMSEDARQALERRRAAEAPDEVEQPEAEQPSGAQTAQPVGSTEPSTRPPLHESDGDGGGDSDEKDRQSKPDEPLSQEEIDALLEQATAGPPVSGQVGAENKVETSEEEQK